MTHTTHPHAPVVDLYTPVSIRVGSDVYAARIIKITGSTVTVESGPEWNPERNTFRPYQGGNHPDGTPIWGWASGPKGCRIYLVRGRSETVLDPSF